MMLESQTPTHSTFFNVKCGNKYSFVSQEDKKILFNQATYNGYQETSKEHHLYNDKV